MKYANKDQVKFKKFGRDGGGGRQKLVNICHTLPCFPAADRPRMHRGVQSPMRLSVDYLSAG